MRKSIQYMVRWFLLFSFVGVCLVVSSSVRGAADSKDYSIEVRNASVSDIVRMLAQMDDKNVVISDKIEGNVTASFQSIHLHDALSAILETHNLGAVIKDDVIRVTTLENIEEKGHDLIIRTVPLKYAKVDKVLTQVESLISERGSVMMDERTNSISVRDTEVKIQDILKLIASIDKIDQQVLIEAKIVEASLEFIQSLGIQWGLNRSGTVSFSGVNTVGSADSGNTLNVNTPASGMSSTNPLSGATLALGRFGGVLTEIQLTAAEEKGDLNILSRPSVVTLNNQEAKIHSGIQFFIQTSGDVTISSGGGSTTGGSNLQQIEAGINMVVTPQITVNEKINLSIDVTESQADFTRQVDGIPTLIDNTAATTVLLNDGETTVIGGLFQIKTQKNRQGVPILHRIPLLGALFRNTTHTKNKTELIIFIKPTIVRDNLSKLPTYPEDDSSEKKTVRKKRHSTGKWQ